MRTTGTGVDKSSHADGDVADNETNLSLDAGRRRTRSESVDIGERSWVDIESVITDSVELAAGSAFLLT